VKSKIRYLFTLMLVASVSVLLAVGSTVIKNKIRDSKQMMLGGFLSAPGGLLGANVPDLAAAQEAQEEAERQKAIAALREARAEAEAARRLSGDPTPTVEAVVVAPDNRFCALIGDDLVDEGKWVQGYRVRKIRGDTVEFEKGDKVWVQKIH